MKLEFRQPHVCFDILYLVRNTKGWFVFNMEKILNKRKGKRCTMLAMLLPFIMSPTNSRLNSYIVRGKRKRQR